MKKPKKKIFAAITGASGGIGRSIIKNLIKKYNLVIFTRKLNKDFKDFLQIQKRKNGSILKIIKADFLSWQHNHFPLTQIWPNLQELLSPLLLYRDLRQ